MQSNMLPLNCKGNLKKGYNLHIKRYITFMNTVV